MAKGLWPVRSGCSVAEKRPQVRNLILDLQVPQHDKAPSPGLHCDGKLLRGLHSKQGCGRLAQHTSMEPMSAATAYRTEPLPSILLILYEKQSVTLDCVHALGGGVRADEGRDL